MSPDKAETGKPKQPIRWDWIETEWQLGRLSNVQIARIHKEKFGRAVSESAIRLHVTQHGWQRDLSDAIRSETRRKLAEGALPQTLRETASLTAPSQFAEVVIEETATVEAASDEAVRVTVQHRTHAERMHCVATALEIYVMAQLPLCEAGRPMLQYEPGELKDIASAASCASNTRGRAIEIERKAYGLDDPEKGKGGGDTLAEIRSFLKG